MYFYICLIILLFSLFESIFKYQNKAKKIFFIFSLILLFILIAFNTWSPDLESYKIHYKSYNEQFVKYSVEPLTLFIMKYANMLGFTFEQYQFFVAFIIIVLLYKSLVNYSPLPAFVLSCFYFIPFFPNVVQVRSFLAYSILIYALKFLNDKKIKFWTLFFLAFLAHYSVLIFLPLIFLRRFAFFKQVKTNHYVIFFSVLLLLLVPKSFSEPLITYINPKYKLLLDQNNTFIGTLVLFIPFYIINSIVLNFHDKRYKTIEHKIDLKYKKVIPVLIELIQYANYTILFQYFIRDTSRITFLLHLSTLVYLSIVIFYGVSSVYSRQKVLFVRSMTLLWTVLIFYVNFLMVNGGDYFKIIEKIFSSNSIFK